MFLSRWDRWRWDSRGTADAPVFDALLFPSVEKHFLVHINTHNVLLMDDLVTASEYQVSYITNKLLTVYNTGIGVRVVVKALENRLGRLFATMTKAVKNEPTEIASDIPCLPDGPH